MGVSKQVLAIHEMAGNPFQKLLGFEEHLSFR